MVELDLVGQTLAGRYKIESRLGDGGMGAVFRARHVKVGRLFAVKVLHPRLVSNPKQLLRFEREANLAGSLRHPHLAAVVDIGELGGLRYLVMEHAEGEPLSTLIERGPLAGDRVLRIAHQLCEGLGHAHSRNLIHRDFKPDNVIVEQRTDGTDFARIIDFGIAILREDLSDTDRDRLTTDGVILGTPHYMAPEQAFGGPFDHRVDLFALGISCYEMLTGRLPFDGDAVAVARANISQATPPMGVRAPALDIDPLLEAFTRALMAKPADERPATAFAAAQLLELIESDRGAAADALGLDRDAVADWIPRITVTTAESRPLARLRDDDLHTDEAVPLDNKREPVGTGDVDPRQVASQRLSARKVLATGDVDPRSVASQQVEAVAITAVRSPAPRRRWLFAVVAVAMLAAGAVLVLALRSRSQPEQIATAADAARADAESIGVEAAPIAVADAAIDAEPVAVVDAAPTVDARDRIAAADASRIADARVAVADAAIVTGSATPDATPRAPADAASAPVDAAHEEPAPSARAVADLYMVLGREIKALSDQNADAAAPLWARYRLIKINDAMATPASQRAALRELSAIRAAIPK